MVMARRVRAVIPPYISVSLWAASQIEPQRNIHQRRTYPLHLRAGHVDLRLEVKVAPTQREENAEQGVVEVLRNVARIIWRRHITIAAADRIVTASAGQSVTPDDQKLTANFTDSIY